MSLLVSQDMTVGTIAEKTNLSIALASKHIKIILQCELIHQVKHGRKKLCKVNFDKLSDANLWLSSVGLLDPVDISHLESFLSTEKML
tara:strand:+ start:419 stop:682 length:264 start_codon:yes stop_codon:yes gene_type:complete